MTSVRQTATTHTSWRGLRRWCAILLALILLSTSLTIPPAVRAASIIVTSLSDVVDAGGGNCGTLTIGSLPGIDGVISLREAICAANNTVGTDTITFQSGLTGTITLTSGELLISSDVTLTGPGATQLVISGNDLSRVMRINGGDVHLNGLALTKGKSDYNGGLSIVHEVGTTTVVTLDQVSIRSNAANVSAGGLGVSSGSTVSILNSSINDNVSGTPYTIGNFGGGLVMGDGATVHIINSTIARNHVIGQSITYAGAIYIYSNNGTASLSVTNSTISGNMVDGSSPMGGGIYVYSAGSSPATVAILNSTMNANTVASIWNYQSNVSLANTIVTNSIHSTSNCVGLVTDAGHNLDDGTACGFSDATGSISGQDPKLGPLDYDDSSMLSHSLLLDSPALNAGNDATCPPTDQRGTSRPKGAHCDIGAYEAVTPLSATPIVVTTSSDIVDAGDCADLPLSSLPGPNGTTSLREAICAATNGLATQTITFSPALNGQTILLTGGTLTISTNLTIAGPGAPLLAVSGNNASGVFSIVAGKPAISGITITAGRANNRSGGIAIQDAAVTLDKLAIIGNSGGDGGGISVFSANGIEADVTVTNSLIANNTAHYSGGGISAVNSVAVTVANTTISSNQASHGGAISIISNLHLRLINSTITGNNTTFGANITTVEGREYSFTNTIVANNSGGLNCDTNSAGTLINNGHNLDDGTSCGFGNANGNLSNTNPQLGPLADNGGPTKTHALLPGSPAIGDGDGAACPATDQRGIVRPQPAGGACDIGAYEVAFHNLTITTSGIGSVIANTTQYREGAIASIEAIPGTDQIFTGWTMDGQFKGWANPLTLTMNAPHSVQATFVPAPTFGDVTGDTRYNQAIAQLAARNIIKGCDQESTPKLFCPDDPTLRAQMAALIARAMAWGGPGASNPFTDKCDPLNPQNCVDSELWDAVGQLASRNVAKGYTDGTTCAPAAAPCYAPRDNVLYAQVISFITRAMVAQHYWTPATIDNTTIYPNIPAASGHRLDFVTYAANVGPIPGTATTTDPFAAWDQPSTRAWFAEALWRALNAYFGNDQPGKGGYAP